MSNPSARVVSAACLFAATLAAQAPVSLRTPLTTLPNHGGGAFAGSSLGTATLAPDWSSRVPQQGTDYSPSAQFLGAHRSFLDGRSRYEPDVSFTASLYPNQHVRHEPGSFDLLGYGFDASLPVALERDTYLLFGLYAHSRQYQFSTTSRLADEGVHAAGVKLGFGWFLDDDLLFELEGRPGIWSDCDGGLHHEDLDVPGEALLTWRAADGLFWKVGARYNQVYQDAPWLPYLGISWNITGTMLPADDAYEVGTWRLDVLLPEYAELSYWPTADNGFQLGLEVSGAEYHVRTAFATGKQRDDLQVQEVTGYLGFTHLFSDTFSLSARAGAVIAGDYGLTNGAAGFDDVEGALDQGLFASVSFGIDW